MPKKGSAAPSEDTIRVRQNIKRWINDLYDEWRKGKRQKESSAREFSAYFGFSEDKVGAWLRGEMGMSGKIAIALANRFGPELYDVLEWDRPDCYQKKPSGQ